MRAIDLIGGRRWLFAGSGLVVLASLVLLAVPPALRPGIEFTSGTTTQLRFEQRVDQAELRDAYAQLGHAEARIQSAGGNQFLIRTSELKAPPGSFSEVTPSGPQAAPVGPVPLPDLGTVNLGAVGATGQVRLRRPFLGDPCSFGDIVGEVAANTAATVRERHAECAQKDVGATVLRVGAGAVGGYLLESDTHDFQPAAAPTATPAEASTERATIEQALRDRFGAFEVLEFSAVSAVVSNAAVRNASVAVVMAALFIMGYIAFAFSSMARPFRYATCAIVALLHDVIVVLGAFSLFGKLFGVEINLMFVTGLLTVIGFSVHDTIVVFDRIRENVSLSPHAPFAQNVNTALIQTLARSLNTSLTVLLTVLALLLLGGATIQSFLLVILIGIISGTYSSVGVAAQLLVSWEAGDFGRLRRRLLPLGRRGAPQPQPPAS
ncbi:MAG: protein translocase subunit SecF [Dehalococcoidia bacterium]|nr:protein translocase subunit SecF [Dehalococcoidia bacterium]